MTTSEASYIIKNYEDKYVNEWNQTRYIAYAVIQSQSTKSLTPQDIMKFNWEIEKEELAKLHHKSKEELIKHSLEMEKKLNQSNGR